MVGPDLFLDRCPRAADAQICTDSSQMARRGTIPLLVLIMMLVLVLLYRLQMLLLLGMRCNLCRCHLRCREVIRWQLVARLDPGLRRVRSSQSLVAAFSTTLGGIFDLGMRVALRSIISNGSKWQPQIVLNYLVCMPEPRCALLLAVDQRNPVIAASTETLPHIRVAVHAPHVLGLLEWLACCGADPVSEALIVPECRVLQHQPTSRLADPTPTLALVSVATNPFWCVQITFKPHLLLMGYHVRIGRVHVLWRRRNLFLVQCSEQIRRV